MKRIIALILALMLMLAFSACGNEAENTEPAEGTENENAETETEVSEETPEVYEEMLLNFGGTYRHDGSLIVSKKGSLYDLREGIEDCSAMTAENYYTWMVSKTENSDKVKVMLPGSDSEVYAFSADFYEGKIAEFFGVSAEELQSADFYYAEQNCYYFEGVSGSGEYVNVDFVSADEAEDTVTLHFTLTDLVSGTTNHALTVKLLEDGGYNYVSYIAE